MADLKARDRSESIHRAVFAFSVALTVVTIFLIIPTLYTLWTGTMSAQGRISLGGWPESSPTPSPTPYLPVKDGTTLGASITASGYLEGEGNSSYAQAAEGAQLEPLTGVLGEVCVANEGQYPTENLSIDASIQFRHEKGAPFEDLDAFLVDVSDQPVIEPGDEACYPYKVKFIPPRQTVLKYRLSASITVHNHVEWMLGGANCSGPQSCPFGPTVAENFQLPVGVPVETDTPVGPPGPMATLTATQQPVPSPTLTATAWLTPTYTSIPLTPTATPTVTPTLIAPPSPTDEGPASTLPATPTVAPTEGVLDPSQTPTPTGTLHPIQPSMTPTFTQTATATSPPQTATPTITPTPFLDLAITQGDNDVTAAPGEMVIYTLTFANLGNQTASGVMLRDVLPGNTSFDSGASSPGWVQLVDTDEYLYRLGDLPAGATGEVIFAVSVHDPFPVDRDLILNSATIQHLGAKGAVDSNPANNTATGSTSILKP